MYANPYPPRTFLIYSNHVPVIQVHEPGRFLIDGAEMSLHGRSLFTTFFSLLCNKGYSSPDPLRRRPPTHALPKRLWEMLLVHSPHLEELTFDAYYPFAPIWDLSPLVSGRWSRLRSISIGDLAIKQAGVDNPYLGFLAAHPTLESVALAEGLHHLSPLVLPPTALPNVRSLRAFWPQVEGMPYHTLIRRLCLTSTPHRPSDVSSVSRVLKNLTSLTSLSIWVEFDEPPGYHTKCFRSLLSSCLQLTHLEILCSSYFKIVSHVLPLL